MRPLIRTTQNFLNDQTRQSAKEESSWHIGKPNWPTNRAQRKARAVRCTRPNAHEPQPSTGAVARPQSARRAHREHASTSPRPSQEKLYPLVAAYRTPTSSTMGDWRDTDLHVSLAHQDAARINGDRGYRHRPGAHPGVGTGNAPGSHMALHLSHALTFQCPSPMCGALVNLLAAKRQANAAARDRYIPGDGCASSTCSIKHKRGRFRTRQRKSAQDLLSGNKILIRRPDRVDATHVWLISSAGTIQTANAVLAQP